MLHPTTEERHAAEQRARQSLEARKGSPFADEEWQEAKTNLVNFFRILAEWQVQAEQRAADPPPAQPRTRTKKRDK